MGQNPMALLAALTAGAAFDSTETEELPRGARRAWPGSSYQGSSLIHQLIVWGGGGHLIKSCLFVQRRNDQFIEAPRFQSEAWREQRCSIFRQERNTGMTLPRPR